MNTKFEKALEILEKNNQKHVIPFLENGKNEELIDQILNIDFEELDELYEKTKNKIDIEQEDLSPISAVNPSKLDSDELDRLNEIGIDVVKNNKFAVATMAGGQGTRLGHDRAKGTFKINLNGQDKYLFELIVDDLTRANNKYNVVIPWYIMTSNENNADTVSFLEEKNYFGYPKEYVYIFKQAELPLIDKKGKVLVDKNECIKEASNGNGGIFNSMLKSKVIDDMDKRGIEWVFIGSVDNVLLKNVDTLLIGITKNKGTQIGTRTVLKRNPQEKVGVLCRQNNKVRVIEYTELPKEISEITDDDGELLYGESHIMCNLFSIDAIKKCSTKALEYHVAVKKSDYLDENKNIVKPDELNAYKFEKFIFDSFKIFDDIAILRGKREEDFAPIKNKDGEDSPETAKKLYENYWKNR